MPKSYNQYTCYPENDHEIYRDIYDGKADKVAGYISTGVNIYQRTKFSLVTPLFLAISGKHIGIIDLLLNVYESDVKFIDAYFRTQNETDQFFLKQPILIAYGTNEIKLVEELYEEYIMIKCKPTTDTVNSTACGVVVLLKENNFTPKRVLYLVPQSQQEKYFVLQLIQIVLHNGQLYLNGCNNISDSMIKVITINGLFPVLQRLIKLGCDYNATELSRLAMKSGQIQFLDDIMKIFEVNINAVAENENDLFNLIGSAEWQMFEWIVTKLIVLNGFYEHNRFFWKNILDMSSDRYNGGTLYHYAIICEQFEFVQKYFSYGPDLKQRNRDGCLPIFHAFHSVKYKKLVGDMIRTDKELLELSVCGKKNVLHLMVERNWCDVFESLLQEYPQTKEIFFDNAEVALAAINQAISHKYTDTVRFIIGMYRDEITHDDLYSFLTTAVRVNAKEIVQYLLTQDRFDLCCPTQKGEYPLMLALSNHNIDIYLAILYKNAPTELHKIKDAQNNTLLRYTIWSRDHFQDDRTYEKCIIIFGELLLLNLEGNNIETIVDQNLIHRSALMGNPTTLSSLLMLKLDVELWDADGNLPIHYAANLATFEILNEATNGLQINMKNKKSGNTPLHMLMIKDFQNEIPSDLLVYMIKNGADVNAVNNLNQTALHLVQYAEWCNILFRSGGDITAIDNEGNTPVHSAFKRLNYKVAMLLFEQDINLNAVNNSGFNYLAGLLQQQCTAQLNPFPNIMRDDNEKILKLVSTYCNACNETGTPLLIESMYSNDLICHMILNEPSCDVKNRDKVTQRSAIHATAMYNKFDLIDRLIKMGANINDQDSNGNTPLHHSCQFFHEHAVDFIVYGANVNAENKNKDTPLHLVALADMHGHTVCQMLLSGANLQAKNNDGNMPYDLLRDDLKQIFKIFLQ